MHRWHRGIISDFSWCHKGNICFMYFIFFISFGGMANLFQKWKLSFPISKMIFYFFFISKISWWHKWDISIFHSSLVVWPILFKFLNENFDFIFQKWKFNSFSFPCGGMAFFQISKTKNFISNLKNEFFLNFSWWHKQTKFLSLRLLNLFKIYKSYLFTFTKNRHILHTTMWWYIGPV
jgi:hypothetical protein